MGFKIGKFIGRIASGAVKSAPSIIAGYAAGGPAGAGLAALGGVSFGGGSQTAPTGQPVSYGGVQSQIGGGYGYPQTMGGSGGGAMPVSRSGVTLSLTKDVFDIVVKLADKLGIPMRMMNRVIPIGRAIIAKLLRFVRATPGLTILAMLGQLGLTAYEANTLISWYATAGRKRRRIRVTNVKALNRSVRRMEGFLRLEIGRASCRERV